MWDENKRKEDEYIGKAEVEVAAGDGQHERVCQIPLKKEKKKQAEILIRLEVRPVRESDGTKQCDMRIDFELFNPRKYETLLVFVGLTAGMPQRPGTTVVGFCN